MTIILGQLLAVLTAACWGQNSLIYSYLGKRIGSHTVTHVRLWIALPAVLLIHFILFKTVLPPDISLSSVVFLSISGLIGFFAADIFIFRSFVELGARETMVIMTLSPIFSALLSWIFLGEILAPLQIAGIVVTILGIIWVIIEENSDNGRIHRHSVKGIIFAVIGALAQAAGMILAKAGMGGDVHPVSANVIRITAGLAGLAVFALLRKEFINDFRKMKNIKLFGLLASAAMVGPVLGIIMALFALSMAPVGIVTTLMQTTPIMLLPIDRFVFKKRVTIRAVAGTFLAICGAAMLFLF